MARFETGLKATQQIQSTVRELQLKVRLPDLVALKALAVCYADSPSSHLARPWSSVEKQLSSKLEHGLTCFASLEGQYGARESYDFKALIHNRLHGLTSNILTINFWMKLYNQEIH